MDQTQILTYLVLALGGVIAANIVGALMRGGGGVLGRTIIGAVGGAAAGLLVSNVEQAGSVAALWSDLLPSRPEDSARLFYLITGAVGGLILGFAGALAMRPRG